MNLGLFLSNIVPAADKLLVLGNFNINVYCIFMSAALLITW